ncbi:unnamed protein product [Clonostachys rosea]|uniref:GPI anchored serine-rich protein n=1 Tax=Bionectria ochroleuca TaxID=29856 RepID=A0ABY6TR66_BIOOC|nr:unnamed protein product [Clonostachys rosea]
MRFSVGIVAVSAALASASIAPSGNPVGSDETTTLTSTTYKTTTVTECAPTVTDCPLRSSTQVPVVTIPTSTPVPVVTPSPSSVYTPSSSKVTPSSSAVSSNAPHWSVNTTSPTFAPTGGVSTTIIPTTSAAATTGNNSPNQPSTSAVPTAGASGLAASGLLAIAAFVALL